MLMLTACEELDVLRIELFWKNNWKSIRKINV